MLIKYIKSDLYRYAGNTSFKAFYWAGSVVTKDIPENSTAAGNYAKVLNNNPNLNYIHNRWNDS